MDKLEAYHGYTLLNGNINKMLLADDVDELLKFYNLAKEQLDKVFGSCYACLNN